MCTGRIPSRGWSAGPDAAEGSRRRTAREGLQVWWLKIMSACEDAALAESGVGGVVRAMKLKQKSLLIEERAELGSLLKGTEESRIIQHRGSWNMSVSRGDSQ